MSTTEKERKTVARRSYKRSFSFSRVTPRIEPHTVRSAEHRVLAQKGGFLTDSLFQLGSDKKPEGNNFPAL